MEFFKRWIDLLVWIPIAAALLLLATFGLPLLDPNAGVDSLGFLQGYAILLLKGIVVVFMAWMCKRTYTKDWSDDIEVALLRHAHSGNWQGLAIDRLEWAMWLGLWFFLLRG